MSALEDTLKTRVAKTKHVLSFLKTRSISRAAVMSSSACSQHLDTPTGSMGSPVDGADEFEDAERNFKPKSLKFWSIIIVMYLSLFLVALDRTIIATSIPRITDEFGLIEDINWYGSAYMLACACFSLIFGRIYQVYSIKWVFVASMIVFEAGSALCGAAPSSRTLIVGRAIAGLGAAGIFSGGMVIIMPLIPLRRRPIFISMFGMVFGISSVVGPILGGIFTDTISWRWCFYINLPIGGLTLPVIMLFLNVKRPKREKLTVIAQIASIDPFGILFFIPSMTCLMVALQWGGSTYPWSAPRIVGLLVSFALLFIIFVVIEILTPETAMAPSRVFLNRSIAGSSVFMFLLAGAFMCVVYYLAIWFQVVKGDSALKAGTNSIPLVLSLAIMSVFVAIFTERVGYYVPGMLLAPILCSAGGGLLSSLSISSNSSQWIGYQVIYGFGIGCGFQTSNMAAQTILPEVDVPLGLALLIFMQQLGGAVFLSVGQNIFSNNLVEMLSGLGSLDAATIIHTGAIEFRRLLPPSELDVVLEACNHALTRVFILTTSLSASVILCALLVEWRSIKEVKHPGGTEMVERRRRDDDSET